MSQYCFSLGFLSQNSLWKLSTLREYKGIYSMMYKESEESVSTKQGILATKTSHEFELRANCLARLEVLSYSATIGIILQLPLHSSHVCHSCDLPIPRSSRETPLNCTLLEISSHSLTHYLYIISTYIQGI